MFPGDTIPCTYICIIIGDQNLSEQMIVGEKIYVSEQKIRGDRIYVSEQMIVGDRICVPEQMIEGV